MISEMASFERRAHALTGELRSISSGAAAMPRRNVDRFSDELSALMMDAYEARSPSAIGELVDGLCELALHADQERSALGQSLIFGSVVESLADSFEPDKALLYDHLFAQVIDYCRHRQAGRGLDACLSRFAVSSSDALIARKERARVRRLFPVEARRRVERVFVPSRVTLGADVAITSIVLQKIERVFPQAECVVFGPAGVGELLEGTAKAVRFVDCPYHRRGGLVARLDSWIQLVEAVRTETGSRDAGTCLFLDPDSRLTQLGLLPVVEEVIPSFFFESRTYRRPGAETLGELTGQWLAEVLGPDEGQPLHPKVVPAASHGAAARRVAEQIRPSGAEHLTTVTLGVGGNARKRISGPFELDLMRGLLSDGGIVILDKGIDEEVARVEAIIAALAAQGTRVVELGANPLRLPDGASGQLLIHCGGLRSLLALVAASDLYVGYDSAFQHVAAALSVPVIDIFVNPPNDLFSRRWRPYSTAAVDVVQVGPDADSRETLRRVLTVYREHRATAADPARMHR